MDKKVLFLGDSLTSGENNNFISYVEHMSGNSTKLAVSGTTIGEYSIYPVDGDSLLSLIKCNEKQIASADIICLEYGVNDVSAIIAGNVTYTQVLIAFTKAYDYIKQLNPRAKTYFLALTFDKSILLNYAMQQVSYLDRDYFRDILDFEKGAPDRLDAATEWSSLYSQLMIAVSRRMPVISVIDDYGDLFNNMDKDGLHPDDCGYKIIADNISRQLVLDNAK